MSEKIVTLNEKAIKGQIRELVRGSVEETLTYCDFQFYPKICVNEQAGAKK